MHTAQTNPSNFPIIATIQGLDIRSGLAANQNQSIIDAFQYNNSQLATEVRASAGQVVILGFTSLAYNGVNLLGNQAHTGSLVDVPAGGFGGANISHRTPNTKH